MPRQLKVLAIHDADLSSGDILGCYSEYITQWKHKIGRTSVTRISQYTQVLTLLKNRLTNPIEIPDIILIDFLFTDDPVKFNINSKLDPRGVLYASILIPFFMANEPYKPMGYEIYSQGIEVAKNFDPDSGYAKTFLLLLSAISGDMSENPLSINEDQLEKIVMSFIENYEGMKKPDDALSPAIKKYRKNFTAMVENGQIKPVITSLENCRNEVLKTNGNLENIVKLEKLSVKWVSIGGNDDVFLSSLFFDCFYDPQDKSEKKYNDVIDFLNDIISKTDNSIEIIYAKAVERYIKFMTEKDEEDTDDKNKYADHSSFWTGTQDQQNNQKVLCLLIAWAVNRYEVNRHTQKKYCANNFIGIVGRKGNNQIMDRVLKNLIGIPDKEKYTTKNFIDMVDISDTWSSLPLSRLSILRSLVIKYLNENGYSDKCYWHQSLKDDEIIFD